MKTIKDKEYSFKHVQTRLKERYNLDIDREEYEEMNGWLENDDIVEISGDQIVSRIYYKETDILLTYCKKRGCITTVLPPKDMNKNIKYPTTLYAANSPNYSSNDKLTKTFVCIPLIITEKMDGSNVKLKRELVAARNGWHADHKSFDLLKQRHSIFKNKIPSHLTLFGEWLYAKHSIQYNSLKEYLQLFAVYDDNQQKWLAWYEVEKYAKIIGCITVPVIKRVTYTSYSKMIKDFNHIGTDIIKEGGEGFVVRNINEFSFSNFSKNVLKYVRANHVQTGQHWSQQKIIKNKLEEL